MNKIFITSLIVLSHLAASSQSVGINLTGAIPDPSALLDISSQEKGILIPRLRTSERLAIPSPAEGLLVYDINSFSFWYHSSGNWVEFLKEGDEVTPVGPAFGDLSGFYPSPTVSKIQNLDIATGFPFDKQVLKWDMLNNHWRASNDSMFLPYHAVYSHPEKLFSITNTSLSPGGASIYGKRTNTGSGITPASSSGVWGDNSDGVGVTGTSNTGIGTFGFSFANHGVFGYSTTADYAGVYGTHANANGIGVMGMIQNEGYSIYGLSSGENGAAGVFENTNSDNNDFTLRASTEGTGSAGLFEVHNSISTSPVIYVYNNGAGNGIQINQSSFTNSANAISAITNGDGAAVYGKSQDGIAGKFEITNTFSNKPALSAITAGTLNAGQFSITNAFNPNALIFGTSAGTGDGIHLHLSNNSNNAQAIHATQTGLGKGMHLVLSNPNNTSHAIHSHTEGKGSAGYFNANSSTNTQPSVVVKQNGTGRGLEAVVSNASSNAAAVYANSSGNNGVQAFAQSTAVYGQATGLTNGIGVLGQSSLNSTTGIGVKGVSYGSSTISGSVTGQNLGDGIGVYGISAGTEGNGIGVYGESSGIDGIGVYGESASDSWGAVHGENTGGGSGLYGFSSGPNATGVDGIADPDVGTFGCGVVGNNFGEGDGIRGFAGIGGNGISGFGKHDQNSRAGFFNITYDDNTLEALKVENEGLGTAQYIITSNAANTSSLTRYRKSGSGDYAVYEDGAGNNKIRFDHTGKGFFNGGTQTGGADIAEAFDTDLPLHSYEAGDVLVISTDNDRTVTKSSTPYSNLVAGVYATKPGVLMTEENIDADISSKIPMGIIGVIPTKVNNEGGPINRGDMLVSSSTPGIAMKADPDKVKIGQVIGKALENYHGNDTVLIRVLVSVK